MCVYELVSIPQCKVVSLTARVRPHPSVLACTLTLMVNPERKPTAPDCRLPPQRCTWLAGLCVCVCREQLFSSATRGGQRETRTSHSCGPGACGNCGLNNVGEEAEEEEKERSGGESTGTKRKLYKLRQDETAGEEETTPEETETKTEERRETSSVTCLVFSREVTAARRGGGARTAKRFLDAPPSVSTTSLSRPII